LVPWANLEERPGQLDKLKKKLRELKLSVSVGLRGPYVIVALAESPALLEGLGRPGQRLADRAEFKPLAKFAERPLTSINYASKEWQVLQTVKSRDFENMVEG